MAFERLSSTTRMRRRGSRGGSSAADGSSPPSASGGASCATGETDGELAALAGAGAMGGHRGCISTSERTRVSPIPSPPATARGLAQRHRLFLLTKGDITEQTGKLERSGLKQHFVSVEVVVEKDAPTYAAIVEKYALGREQTWMIGNSPKSDINPALEAGLHAVFVPHHNTWELERGEVLPEIGNGRLLQVPSFGRLREFF